MGKRIVLDASFKIVDDGDPSHVGMQCNQVYDSAGSPCDSVRQAERRRMQSQLAHQEKMAAFGLFAAGVAHEIGNPLAAISSELELLLGERDLYTVQRSLGQIRVQVGRISRILRELADFARRRRDEETDLSLNAVVQDTLRLIRPDPRMRSVSLSLSLDPEIPAVHLVEDHLVQVLLNLLLNALDAMPEGGQLTVRTSPVDSEVILEVSDSGVGMTDVVLQRAFEPFFTTKPQGKGTGLGLSICSDIIEAAGGRVEVESSAGAGATFRVFLPARSAEEG